MTKMNMDIKRLNTSQFIFDKMSTALYIFGLNRSLHSHKRSKLAKLVYLCYSLIWVLSSVLFLVSYWPLLKKNKPLNYSAITLKYVVAAIFGLVKSNGHLNKSYHRMISISPFNQTNKCYMKYFMFITLFLVLEFYNLFESFSLSFSINQLRNYGLWLLILVINVDCFWMFSLFYIIDCKLHDVYRRLKLSKARTSVGYSCKRPLFILTSKFIRTTKKHYFLKKYFLEYKCIVRTIKACVWILDPLFIVHLVAVMIYTSSNIVNGILEMGDKIKMTFTLSTILFFTNIRFKSLFLFWIICLQGESIKNNDYKIKTILTELSLEMDDFNPEKRVASKFLRYIERNRNKLKMWRMVNIELKLSWACFMKLFEFTLLVIQMTQIF